MSAVQIDFYTKPGCHLCLEALDVLKKLQKDFDFEIRSVNILESSEFMTRYQDQHPGRHFKRANHPQTPSQRKTTAANFSTARWHREDHETHEEEIRLHRCPLFCYQAAEPPRPGEPTAIRNPDTYTYLQISRSRQPGSCLGL